MQHSALGVQESNASHTPVSDSGVSEDEVFQHKRRAVKMDVSLFSESTLDMDLSSAVSSVTREADTSSQNENLRKQTKKIASGVGHATIEIITGLITLLFILCLLTAGLVRDNYTSLVYLVTFFMTIAFPSHYPYFFQLPVYRLLMLTPRFLFSILVTVFSLMFLITFVTLQIVFKYGDRAFFTPTAEQILRDFGFVWYVYYSLN
jgi:hypothetical protein